MVSLLSYCSVIDPPVPVASTIGQEVGSRKAYPRLAGLALCHGCLASFSPGPPAIVCGKPIAAPVTQSSIHGGVSGFRCEGGARAFP